MDKLHALQWTLTKKKLKRWQQLVCHILYEQNILMDVSRRKIGFWNGTLQCSNTDNWKKPLYTDRPNFFVSDWFVIFFFGKIDSFFLRKKNFNWNKSICIVYWLIGNDNIYIYICKTYLSNQWSICKWWPYFICTIKLSITWNFCLFITGWSEKDNQFIWLNPKKQWITNLQRYQYYYDQQYDDEYFQVNKDHHYNYCDCCCYYDYVYYIIF